MRVEEGPAYQSYLEPSEDWESFFTAALEGLVETVFTHDAIEEMIDPVRGTAHEAELGNFMSQQKGFLYQHLEETVRLAITQVIADLKTRPGDPFQD